MHPTDALCLVAFVLWPLSAGLWLTNRPWWKLGGSMLLGLGVPGLLSIVALKNPILIAVVTLLTLSGPALVMGALAGARIPWLKRVGVPFQAVLGALGVAGWLTSAVTAWERVERVETSVLVRALPQPTWDSVKGFGALGGDRPVLMRLGLPEPRRCTLHGEGVGARRVCHFDSGYIEQRIVQWEPPFHMGLAIVETNLPHRYISFTAATYELTEQGAFTQVSRTTTIRSYLAPAWLWRPIEHRLVQTEHRYLLEDLRQRFESATRD